MISTRMTPKNRNRYSNASRPAMLMPRNRSGRYPISAPPRMTPAMLPEPPITTPASTRIEKKRAKFAELMKPCSPANRAPERPPMAAPMANAHSLNRNVGTPIASAASSSSRTATQARPTRLRSRFRTAMTTRMISDRPSQ